MDILITPSKLRGTVSVIPSKSQAHRLMICAAFADNETTLICPETSRDMDATANCLIALGAQIKRTETGFLVIPTKNIPKTVVLPCRDSGSTLRFLLPVTGALGVEATFLLEGRLSQRPLSPLWEEMERMGCKLSKPTPDTILCQSQLYSGEYVIDGDISSQFVTGLLLALPLLDGCSNIKIRGRLQSRPYVDMTLQVLSQFGIHYDNYAISGKQRYQSPRSVIVEGDWSNGAFFLAARELGSDVCVENLSLNSAQGDRAAAYLFPALQKNITISAADIPDLVPILAVTAACRKGATFTDIKRLRLKESDRVMSVMNMISALGGQAELIGETLKVHGTGLLGGTVASVNDHRIAMSAAIASTACKKTVRIIGAESVEKSYPRFWEEFRRLGGNYEQYLR